jgi:hypothetical protein
VTKKTSLKVLKKTVQKEKAKVAVLKKVEKTGEALPA